MNTERTAAVHRSRVRELRWRPGTTAPSESSPSLVYARAPSEPRLDALAQLVADLAISVEPLLAAAGRNRGIGGGPIFHLDGKATGELERLVMRFRRERHDHVEIEPLPFLELLERRRPVPVDVEPDLVHH